MRQNDLFHCKFFLFLPLPEALFTRIPGARVQVLSLAKLVGICFDDLLHVDNLTLSGRKVHHFVRKSKVVEDPIADFTAAIQNHLTTLFSKVLFKYRP